jgi:hypothetical protein
VVEDAVNAVGVDLNTASAPLLARVAGSARGWPRRSSRHRDAERGLRHPRELKKVARLGPKAFEQCAGFLRIRDGKEPLDASSVHPEAYERRAQDRRRLRPRHPQPDGRRRGAEGLNPAAVRRRKLRPADGEATSWRSWKSPAATRAPASSPPPSPKGSRTSRT